MPNIVNNMSASNFVNEINTYGLDSRGGYNIIEEDRINYPDTGYPENAFRVLVEKDGEQVEKMAIRDTERIQAISGLRLLNDDFLTPQSAEKTQDWILVSEDYEGTGGKLFKRNTEWLTKKQHEDGLLFPMELRKNPRANFKLVYDEQGTYECKLPSWVTHYDCLTIDGGDHGRTYLYGSRFYSNNAYSYRKAGYYSFSDIYNAAYMPSGIFTAGDLDHQYKVPSFISAKQNTASRITYDILNTHRPITITVGRSYTGKFFTNRNIYCYFYYPRYDNTIFPSSTTERTVLTRNDQYVSIPALKQRKLLYEVENTESTSSISTSELATKTVEVPYYDLMQFTKGIVTPIKDVVDYLKSAEVPLGNIGARESIPFNGDQRDGGIISFTYNQEQKPCSFLMYHSKQDYLSNLPILWSPIISYNEPSSLYGAQGRDSYICLGDEKFSDSEQYTTPYDAEPGNDGAVILYF